MMEHEGRWTLIGLVSDPHPARLFSALLQVSAGYSCAKNGQPGIYHRVAKTSDWISRMINL